LGMNTLFDVAPSTDVSRSAISERYAGSDIGATLGRGR
jgi:hypothetical protein